MELLKKSKGNIVNIGSVHSVVTSDEIAGYASSKAAITGLTRNLAIELSQFGIRVNNICPGAVDTKMLRAGLLRGHAGDGDSDTLVNNLKNILRLNVSNESHVHSRTIVPNPSHKPTYP